MTREFKIIITIFLLFFFSNQLSAFAKSLNNEIDVNNRIREISQNVRCLVCQNQSIDESNSELAKDLKILIKEKLILGDSDEEIYGFLKKRYGDYPVKGMGTKRVRKLQYHEWRGGGKLYEHRVEMVQISDHV